MKPVWLGWLKFYLFQNLGEVFTGERTKTSLSPCLQTHCIFFAGAFVRNDGYMDGCAGGSTEGYLCGEAGAKSAVSWER